MRIRLILAIVFFILAVMAFGAEVVASIRAGEYQFLTLGQLWYNIDPASLSGLQAGIQRFVWPPLWDPGIIFILNRPAWSLPLLLAGLFFLLDIRRAGRGKRRQIFK